MFIAAELERLSWDRIGDRVGYVVLMVSRQSSDSLATRVSLVLRVSDRREDGSMEFLLGISRSSGWQFEQL